jgi:DNA-binding transcriptional MerR regulator/uncharacterized protein (DUF433 family)
MKRIRLDSNAALALSAQQVSAITGLSIGQLRYWDETIFFRPEFSEQYGFGAFRRVYSYRDLVGLHAIAILRKRHHFSLQKLRPVARFLRKYHKTTWASLRLYVSGRDILFEHPDRPDHLITAGEPGQHVMRVLELRTVARQVERRLNSLRRRPPSAYGKITRSRFILRNALVVRGTRIPTSAIWNFAQAGYNAASIIREYPRLTEAYVYVALAHEGRARG